MTTQTRTSQIEMVIDQQVSDRTCELIEATKHFGELIEATKHFGANHGGLEVDIDEQLRMLIDARGQLQDAMGRLSAALAIQAKTGLHDGTDEQR